MLFKKSILLSLVVFFLLSYFSSLYIFNTRAISSPAESDLKHHQQAARIADICNIKQKDECYEIAFKNIVRNNGPLFGQTVLTKLWEYDVSTRSCHLISHVIAAEAVGQNPNKWEEYMNSVDYNICNGGFLHGILEAHLGEDPDFKIYSKSINDLCLKGEWDKKHTCVHSMGHLLLVQYEDNILKALDGCEGIKENFTEECYLGVYMGDFFPELSVEHGLREAPNRQDQSFIKRQKDLCLKFTGKRAVACWTALGESLGEYYNDPQKAHKDCFEAPTYEQGVECFVKAAGWFAIHPDYSSDEKLISICLPADKDRGLYKSCVNRVISSLINHSPEFFERGDKFCSNVENWFKDDCYQKLSKRLINAVKLSSERKQFCGKLPPKYREGCLLDSD